MLRVFSFCVRQEGVSSVHFFSWRLCRRWPKRTTRKENCGPPEQTPVRQWGAASVGWGLSPCPWQSFSSAQAAQTLTIATAPARSLWPTATTTPSCSTPTSRAATRTSVRPAACPWPTKPWRWWTGTQMGPSSQSSQMRLRESVDAARAVLYCYFTPAFITFTQLISYVHVSVMKYQLQYTTCTFN